MTAFAADHGSRAAAGALMAVWAVGSGVGGLAYGGREHAIGAGRALGAPGRRLPAVLAAARCSPPSIAGHGAAGPDRRAVPGALHGRGQPAGRRRGAPGRRHRGLRVADHRHRARRRGGSAAAGAIAQAWGWRQGFVAVVAAGGHGAIAWRGGRRCGLRPRSPRALAPRRRGAASADGHRRGGPQSRCLAGRVAARSTAARRSFPSVRLQRAAPQRTRTTDAASSASASAPGLRPLQQVVDAAEGVGDAVLAAVADEQDAAVAQRAAAVRAAAQAVVGLAGLQRSCPAPSGRPGWPTGRRARGGRRRPCARPRARTRGSPRRRRPRPRTSCMARRSSSAAEPSLAGGDLPAIVASHGRRAEDRRARGR